MEKNENVKDLLEEVKDLSELMLSLGYSSVFFKNKDIAKEVMLLFERLEELEEKLYLHLFAASRGRPAKKLIAVIDIMESSKFVAAAARNLSELVLEDKEMHPVIKHALEDSEDASVWCNVSDKSILCNNTMGELKIRTNTGVQIVAVRREKKWIFAPKKTTKIEKGDVLIGVGPSSGCRILKDLASGELKTI